MVDHASHTTTHPQLHDYIVAAFSAEDRAADLS
jgi:hypothetical protein